MATDLKKRGSNSLELSDGEKLFRRQRLDDRFLVDQFLRREFDFYTLLRRMGVSKKRANEVVGTTSLDGVGVLSRPNKGDYFPAVSSYRNGIEIGSRLPQDIYDRLGFVNNRDLNLALLMSCVGVPSFVNLNTVIKNTIRGMSFEEIGQLVRVSPLIRSHRPSLDCVVEELVKRDFLGPNSQSLRSNFFHGFELSGCNSEEMDRLFRSFVSKCKTIESMLLLADEFSNNTGEYRDPPHNFLMQIPFFEISSIADDGKESFIYEVLKAKIKYALANARLDGMKGEHVLHLQSVFEAYDVFADSQLHLRETDVLRHSVEVMIDMHYDLWISANGQSGSDKQKAEALCNLGARLRPITEDTFRDIKAIRDVFVHASELSHPGHFVKEFQRMLELLTYDYDYDQRAPLGLLLAEMPRMVELFGPVVSKHLINNPGGDEISNGVAEFLSVNDAVSLPLFRQGNVESQLLEALARNSGPITFAALAGQQVITAEDVRKSHFDLTHRYNSASILSTETVRDFVDRFDEVCSMVGKPATQKQLEELTEMGLVTSDQVSTFTSENRFRSKVGSIVNELIASRGLDVEPVWVGVPTPVLSRGLS